MSISYKRYNEGLPTTLLTQLEVAKMLKVSPKWLQIQRRKGNLKYFQFGHRTIRIPVTEVDRLAKEAEK